MRAIRRFGAFWYDFVVGDDWTMAVGVVLAIGLTWALAQAGLPAWPVMPVAVFSLLAMSVTRARRAAEATRAADGP
jgi:hypothetical protein